MGLGGWINGEGRRRRQRRRRRRRLRHRGTAPLTLADLPQGESGVLDSLQLPDDIALRLMELGFLPGAVIVAGRAAPGGDPRVYRVDGSEIALRAETSQHLLLRFEG